MKKFILIGLGIFLVGVVGTWGYLYNRPALVPKGSEFLVEGRELDKYSFSSLRKRGGMESEIEFLGKPKEVDIRRKKEVNSEVFKFSSDEKKISGMMSWPRGFSEKKKYPVIVMIRGYADKEEYYPGYGTWRVADELVKEGYITVSLDFLGYGESDGESNDMLEARFEKPIAILDLLESIKSLDYVDSDRVGIWAHSNGGQITVSLLEITGRNYPTVLWAPVVWGFPEGVLVYADDFSDGGVAVRSVVGEFEKHYDSRLYSIDWYLEGVGAPVLIIQGDADEWVELSWQADFRKKMNQLGKEVDLLVYKGADHNLTGSWDEAVKDTLEFFKKKI